MSKLLQILADLATDPLKAEKFKSNPDAIMDFYGLNERERELLQSGDRGKIASALGDEIGGVLPAKGYEPED